MSCKLKTTTNNNNNKQFAFTNYTINNYIKLVTHLSVFIILKFIWVFKQKELKAIKFINLNSLL